MAGPLDATATLLELAALGPFPTAALSECASAGPAPWLTAVDLLDAVALLPLAKALSDAAAMPLGPVCSALDEDLAAAGPAPVTAVADPCAVAAMLDTAAATLSAKLGPKPAWLLVSLLATAGPPCACARAWERVVAMGVSPCSSCRLPGRDLAAWAPATQKTRLRVVVT